MTLNDYLPDAGLEIPKTLNKMGSVIKIHGHIVSSRAREYYNISFFGTMTDRRGIQYSGRIKEEYVLGQTEVRKKDGGIDPANIRVSRFTSKNQIKKYARLLNEFAGGNGDG